MSEKRRFLDVWIIEGNTVYREVPFDVVSDWIQQARLLAEDRVRPSGTRDWFLIGATPELASFLPRPEPFAAEDAAEALESVQLDFAWKARPADEDEDVDMIPLIDISLVLLIFFMMTSTVAVAAMRANVPQVPGGANLIGNPDMIWIGIQRDKAGKPVYSIGQGEKGAEKRDLGLTQEQVLAKLDERIKDKRVDVRITADENLARKVIRDLTVELGKRQASPLAPDKHGVLRIYAEVTPDSEKPK